ncbi:hypothetical protein BS78_01G125100 [Paspalum vaginatum]|nr:hypothetical protein BS78_01G125100 [Paspalum vaginatum]
MDPSTVVSVGNRSAVPHAAGRQSRGRRWTSIFTPQKHRRCGVEEGPPRGGSFILSLLEEQCPCTRISRWGRGLQYPVRGTIHRGFHGDGTHGGRIDGYNHCLFAWIVFSWQNLKDSWMDQ